MAAWWVHVNKDSWTEHLHPSTVELSNNGHCISRSPILKQPGVGLLSRTWAEAIIFLLYLSYVIQWTPSNLNPWNEATPLIRTLWLVPRVAGLEGVHCTLGESLLKSFQRHCKKTMNIIINPTNCIPLNPYQKSSNQFTMINTFTAPALLAPGHYTKTYYLKILLYPKSGVIFGQ